MRYKIKPLSSIYDIDLLGKYVCIRLTGLLGDTIHASTKFNYILDKYPDHRWIIIHSYPIQGNIEPKIRVVVDNLLSYWFDNGRIAHYFYDSSGRGGDIACQIPEIMKAKKHLSEDIPFIDGAVNTKRYDNMTMPLLGILPKPQNSKKAIILRRSAWHSHFPKRNRSYMEWCRIEQELIRNRFEVSIIGIEDNFPNKNRCIDLRNQLSVRQVLEYTKDAAICITPATFLYVWTQFICPTLVLSDPNDVNNLNTNWKLSKNMKVYSCNNLKYMDTLFEDISSIKNKYWGE